MIKFLKKLYNRIFYKRNAEFVMNIMSECEAYKNYKQTLENSYNYIIDIKEKVQKDISRSVNTRKYISTTEFNIRDYTKYEMEMIKDYFILQGYKVKIKKRQGYYQSKIILKWNHFKKED